MGVSTTAKQIFPFVQHRDGVKQHEEHPDNFFESDKKKGRRCVLTEEHRNSVVDSVDANPSIVVVEVTEHLMQQTNDSKVTRNTVYSLMRNQHSVSLRQTRF
ncbi:hypothetical protein G6F57_004280 [Rhizopus arrhizus]|uniref:Uncharacterized protein n=1 Tax=Rhizopus oryzae TaxID=64495 RepID=A0A9P7BTA3_RHIOR|nr:hypothetical protein G6F23_000819 [Rhizopus arrhizus]KAG1249329.1 hypothetical protein G6F68_013393 [Rhizopus microsporus]KAG1420606.1 hypothetical protein G6F58_004106 [Rhizopus delemar]KAG0765410.1 hypothetical protein G6F24_004448 [Rhizopus arrhizus]KAG0790598.1 hypothetical protein G6F21_005694 [Rhizopus arrhizus]